MMCRPCEDPLMRIEIGEIERQEFYFAAVLSRKRPYCRAVEHERQRSRGIM